MLWATAGGGHLFLRPGHGAFWSVDVPEPAEEEPAEAVERCRAAWPGCAEGFVRTVAMYSAVPKRGPAVEEAVLRMHFTTEGLLRVRVSTEPAQLAPKPSAHVVPEPIWPAGDSDRSVAQHPGGGTTLQIDSPLERDVRLSGRGVVLLPSI